MPSYKQMDMVIMHNNSINTSLRTFFKKIPDLAGTAKKISFSGSKNFKAELCIDQSFPLVFRLQFFVSKELITIHQVF